MCVLVPFYWDTYGPSNFLYFCDVALFLTLGALWLESTGMTAYMFDLNIPRFSRGLSLFHGWLPFLLLVLVFRLGYDVRSFRRWTVLAWGLMLV